MSFLKFKKQVSLLLKVLPIIAEEKSFALHGGTGINLFQNNMPRLSVDIDLTYLEKYDFHRFPAVQWKLQNVNHFRRVNTEKHRIYIDSLKQILGL